MHAAVSPVGIYKTNNSQDNVILYKEHIMNRIQGNYGVGKRN